MPFLDLSVIAERSVGTVLHPVLLVAQSHVTVRRDTDSTAFMLALFSDVSLVVILFFGLGFVVWILNIPFFELELLVMVVVVGREAEDPLFFVLPESGHHEFVGLLTDSLLNGFFKALITVVVHGQLSLNMRSCSFLIFAQTEYTTHL